MSIRLRFCGAAGTVTGSCYWLRHPGGQLVVDCGLFQGSKTLKALNYDDFPFDPRQVDAVLLTHAHMDHSGLLPKLIKQGFSGPVYATEGTRDLLSYMLPDSGSIQESEVRHLNRRRAQRGQPEVVPMYTRVEGEAALEPFRTIDYEYWFNVGDGVRARFWNSGHILGAASIELEVATGEAGVNPLRLFFSGDLGPEHKLFHPDPEGPRGVDYLVCEATYGNRQRADVPPALRRERLAAEVNEALDRGGVLLMPAFAVERTQELLADLLSLIDSGAIREVPIFLDSPLAIRATEVFEAHADELEPDGGGRISLRHPCLRFSETVEQSKAIARYDGGVIVLAGSGMCDAGRIRHHLKRGLWRRDWTVLLTGYQAAGTLGSLLLGGVSAVRIQGEEIRVQAKVRSLDLYSGHADADELLEWIRERLPVTRALFLTHGEARSLDALRAAVVAMPDAPTQVVIPQLDDEIDLRAEMVASVRSGPHRLPPEAVTAPDWHNDLAQFSLDLRARLEQAGSAEERKRLLQALRQELD
ncbi:MAG: MBL fold metallo-hydrolase [Gammaproteobacteria bacterium]|nr:MBL fold metallo-hydrolase [Gammaproteobacteria bacterium]